MRKRTDGKGGYLKCIESEAKAKVSHIYFILNTATVNSQCFFWFSWISKKKNNCIFKSVLGHQVRYWYFMHVLVYYVVPVAAIAFANKLTRYSLRNEPENENLALSNHQFQSFTPSIVTQWSCQFRASIYWTLFVHPSIWGFSSTLAQSVPMHTVALYYNISPLIVEGISLHSALSTH